MDTIKSLPVAELEVTALIHTFIDQDGTNTETEVINKDLDARASFKEFNGRCACCGSTRLAYACRVVHKPTMSGHYVGRDCATKLMNMADGAYNRMSVALAEKAKSRRRRNWWLHQNPQHREIIEWAEGSSHYIVSDIVWKLKAYGSLSDKQVDLLHRIRQQEADRAAEAAADPQPTGPAPEGRIEVEVEVLGTKAVESTFGYRTTYVTKALVRLAGYNTKAWLTSAGLGKGDKAVIRATFTRSSDDKFFAFGSRPKVVSRLN